MKRIETKINDYLLTIHSMFLWLTKKKHYRLIVLGLCVALSLIVLITGTTTVYADIQSSATLAENETNSFVKIIGNSALFICLLLFGVSQYFGTELGRWGKKLIFGAIIGSAVILNASTLRDMIWGNVGTQ